MALPKSFLNIAEWITVLLRWFFAWEYRAGCNHACLLLSCQTTACTEQICMGSVMTPSQHVRKSEETRTKEEVLLLAKDFIDQYYSSIKR